MTEQTTVLGFAGSRSPAFTARFTDDTVRSFPEPLFASALPSRKIHHAIAEATDRARAELDRQLEQQLDALEEQGLLDQVDRIDYFTLPLEGPKVRAAAQIQMKDQP